MKPIVHMLIVLLAGGHAAHAAEHLWDDFDAYSPGSIADQPGWAAAPWLNTQTAMVVAANSYSPSNALALPQHINGSSAVHADFISTYSPETEHPVIRFSARIFMGNTNIPFEVGLRNSAAGAFLAFRGANGTGTFGFNTPGAGAIPLISNRHVDVTGYYNRSHNTYRLDYDNTYVVPWTLSDSDPTTHTQFNQFAILRDSTGPADALWIDNVSVATFPPHVWAWWRCSPDPIQAFNEQLGMFQPSFYWYYGDEARRGAADPIWDGSADSRNEGAVRLLIAGPMDCVVPTPVTTNWTVEAVFRMRPDSNVTIFEWGKGLGFSDPGSRIALEYQSSQNIAYRLRDREEPTTDSEFTLMAPYSPNGRWQHVALVKSNTTIHLYLDYQHIASRGLSSSADGTYAFGTDTRASIGMSLNGGNTSTESTVIDEVRLSGKALDVFEILQPGQPMIVDIRGNALNNDPWPLTAKCILGKTYHLETSPVLGPSENWQPIAGSGFTAASPFDFINVPNTVPRTHFVRLVRED